MYPYTVINCIHTASALTLESLVYEIKNSREMYFSDLEPYKTTILGFSRGCDSDVCTRLLLLCLVMLAALRWTDHLSKGTCLLSE
jgi:hypothetical protein